MYNPFPRLFDESGMSVREFSESAGLKYGTAYDIVKGRTNIDTVSVDVFIKAAHAFCLTADELLEMAEEQSLDPAEAELLRLYRSCGRLERSIVLAAMRGIAAEASSIDAERG